VTALAKHDAVFSAEQTNIIKQVLCPEINDAQLAMFAQVCRRTGLDPFAKQIYVTLRNTNEGTKERPRWVKKMTIQTGIDGFRLIAERTGKYAGQGSFEWCGDDGVWKDIWLSDKPPAAARATIYRSDWERPIVRIARWKAYTQNNSMWSKMDAEQLAKCAEALCLRAAFPQDLSGLYTEDEMMQAEPVQARVMDVPQPEPKQLASSTRKLPTSTSKKYEPAPNIPFKSLTTKQLVEYIAHYSAKLDDPNLNDFHRQGVKDHVQAAELELMDRREAEAEMAGANVETGEVPLDEAPLDGGDKSETRTREPGEDDEP